jgi:large subunit ribosomal protein L29
MVKAEKIRGIDTADVQRQIQDAQEQLFRLRFQMGMGQSEGLKKYRNLRKERARMLTVLREREIGGETLPVAVSASPTARKAAAPKAKGRLVGLFRRKGKG